MDVEITNIDPPEIDIGELWEVLIKGTGLNEAGLEAFVMDGAGKEIDASILVGQPLSDDTFEDRFPITIDVPGKTPSGRRRVGIKNKSDDVKGGSCPKDSTTCHIFDAGIYLK